MLAQPVAPQGISLVGCNKFIDQIADLDPDGDQQQSPGEIAGLGRSIVVKENPKASREELGKASHRTDPAIVEGPALALECRWCAQVATGCRRTVESFFFT